jgi:hypothetical protein
MQLAHVLTIDEEGKTRRLEEFFDRAEALEAGGLRRCRRRNVRRRER